MKAADVAAALLLSEKEEAMHTGLAGLIHTIGRLSKLKNTQKGDREKGHMQILVWYSKMKL